MTLRAVPVLVLAASMLIGVLVCLGLHRHQGPSGATSTQDRVVLQLQTPCDAAGAGCNAHGGGVHMLMRFKNKVQPLTRTTFTVALEDFPDPAESITATFRMPGMNMGENRYVLVAGTGGVWRGDIMLPVCTSGRRDWVVEVQVLSKGRSYRAEMPFTSGT